MMPINVSVGAVKKRERGKRVKIYHGRTTTKIPINACYVTSNGHYPNARQGCGYYYIENLIYWDKNLNKIKDIRILDSVTWCSRESVPRNVITLHLKELRRAVGEIQRKKATVTLKGVPEGAIVKVEKKGYYPRYIKVSGE